jgi:hypothetical protein
MLMPMVQSYGIHYKTKKDNREIVERDENFIDGDRKGYGGSVYFAEYKNWSQSKRRQLRMLAVEF